MSGQIRVGLAQIDSRLGAVEANVEKHLAWIERARRKSVDLLVFPELSLTGYRLLHLTSRVAQRLDRSAAVESLCEAAGAMHVVVGLVEISERGRLHNTLLWLHDGRILHRHRKLYLPTYGIFQERRFMSPGHRLDLVPGHSPPVGALICEDLWHPHLARRLAAAGARLLVVTSAGPGRLGSGPAPASHDDWQALTRSTALVDTVWVVYCNRTGWEEGSFYGGGSHVVHPGGQILERAEILEEQLLIADLDLVEADRVRWRLPLVGEHRTDIEGPE